ncbi:NADH:ubiquinone oxidoreductase subunit H [Platysternon megacephalum]|uniref:NADH:ubiquinone oxidoreductase subunit H n=1 Tax=Platysternon megacephalum TaxID=55544 RepID=A0A4D9DF18_9SAUR|nr:NADH:ubiquinone oxidoreductase subunit H [Platysternon megacephalum]
MARLECAAEGHPSPQISWQKDGGTDFPAARERRMHVMPEDDVFFIANVKIEDMGIYSCMAQNIAGGLSANATLTVLGKESTILELYRSFHVTFFVMMVADLNERLIGNLNELDVN